jgi:hypothetical protein
VCTHSKEGVCGDGHGCHVREKEEEGRLRKVVEKERFGMRVSNVMYIAWELLPLLLLFINQMRFLYSPPSNATGEHVCTRTVEMWDIITNELAAFRDFKSNHVEDVFLLSFSLLSFSLLSSITFEQFIFIWHFKAASPSPSAKIFSMSIGIEEQFGKTLIL